MNFHNLFEALEWKRNDAQVTLYEEGDRPILVNEAWLQHGELRPFFSPRPYSVQKRKNQDQQRTLRLFKKIVQAETANCPTEKVTPILQKIKLLKKEGSTLTAGKVREIYKQVIAAHLTGIRRIAALGRDDDRIILHREKFKVRNVYFANTRTATRNENCRTLENYYQSLIKEWGEARVHRAMARHDIDIVKMIENKEALRVNHVNRITLALADFYHEDLILCWNGLVAFCEENLTLDELPDRDKRLIIKLLNINPRDNQLESSLKGALKKRFNDYLTRTYDALPLSIQQFIKEISLLDSHEIELMLQGRRIEGIIGGNTPTVYSDFFHSYDIVDRERLQLYQKILNAHSFISPDKMERFYDELLAKGVVKKEMKKGMLIPTPFLRENSSSAQPITTHYEVKQRIITGRGKFAYYLEGKTLKDCLLYRSTSSSPSALDSFTGVLTDLNPFAPPGYLWKRAGEKKERAILFKRTNKPIHVVGHSLGGVHAQLLLMNRIKQDRKIINDLPNREIEIVTFDAPMMRLRCSGVFSHWIDQPENSEKAKKISIEHYISDRDPAHRLGDVPLGWGADKSRLKKYAFIKMEPLNKLHPEMRLHPHNRRYLSTRPGIDFKETELNVDAYHTQAWDVMEVIRRIVGIIFYPIVYILGFLKRFFFGWRGGQAGITKIFHKILPPRPLNETG